MGPNLFANYGEAVSAILFCIGFTNLLLQTNLIKKIIGLNIMDSAIYLFLAEKGYIAGRVAPIVVNGVTSTETYINPIPSGLVLTGIVVSVSVTALMLSLTVRLLSALISFLPYFFIFDTIYLIRIYSIYF